jgi:four helix bundle protein
MRDHSKLKVFKLADRLVLRIYQETGVFPATERYGLQSQIRRAAISIAANIVEGSARSRLAEYSRFIEIAYGLQYEIGLNSKLGSLNSHSANQLDDECTSIAKALNALLRALRKL